MQKYTTITKNANFFNEHTKINLNMIKGMIKHKYTKIKKKSSTNHNKMTKPLMQTLLPQNLKLTHQINWKLGLPLK